MNSGPGSTWTEHQCRALGCRTQKGYGTQYPCRPGERTRESSLSLRESTLAKRNSEPDRSVKRLVTVVATAIIRPAAAVIARRIAIAVVVVIIAALLGGDRANGP